MDYVKNSIASFCKKNKVNLIFLVVCLLVIFVSSFCASCVQSDGFTVKVTDLRDETNTGSITNTSVGEDGATVETETAVKGKVVSGILFVPNNASAENRSPQSCSRTDISTTAKCNSKTQSNLRAEVSSCLLLTAKDTATMTTAARKMP